MNCRECKNIRHRGNKSWCIFYPEIEHFGELPDQPIKESCGHYQKEKEEPAPEETCFWEPYTRYWKNGLQIFKVKTSCGHVRYYNSRNRTGAEVRRGICEKCGKFITMKWRRGME